MQITTNGVALEVDRYDPAPDGPPPRLPILLIMGLGMPRTAWPPQLVEALVAAGHPVIRFDNRDIGLSSRLAQWGKPNLLITTMKYAMHWPVHSAYTLQDMAEDTIGLLDALQLPRVHVVGVSMGGMIGQLLCASAPDRVASFTCIMSSSGARHLPGPTAAVRQVLLGRPRGKDIEAIVDHYVKVLNVIGSPAWRVPEEEMRERIRVHLAPYYFPLGTARQIVAIAASGDRTPLLARVRTPTLIVHGREDPLVPVAAASDLARKIPGARLEVIAGMGHDLPPGLVPRLVALITDNARRADAHDVSEAPDSPSTPQASIAGD